MPLLGRLRGITVGGLEAAAGDRLDEAAYLAEGGFITAAIYLGGYAAEILVGAALLKAIGFGGEDPVPEETYRQLINRARKKSDAPDRSHPVDGLARLLVGRIEAASDRSYTREFGREVVDQATRLCWAWGPRLRYSELDARAEEFASAHSAIVWIVTRYPEF